MGIFVLSDIYNKTMYMKVKLTEEQYRFLTNYINEARKAKPPVSLKEFVGKNPNAEYLSIVQHNKNGNESEYYLKLIKSSSGTGLQIQDVNVGTKTGTQHGKREGCIIDAHLDTMIYGNKFSLSFGQCGTLNIDDVIGAKIYADEQSAKSGNALDEMKLEHDLGKPNEDLLYRYHDMLGSLKVDQEVYFDSKYKWDGIVTMRNGDKIQIELYKGGIPDVMNEAEVVWDKTQVNTNQQQGQPAKKKPVKKPLTLSIDLNQNPFYEEDGQIFFKTTAYDKYTEERNDFVIPIKKFDVSDGGPEPKNKVEKPEDSVEDMSGEDMVALGKEAMAMILNDPLLKKAFYKHPNLWQLFKAEMNGKKAPGTGIVPTLQLLGKYGSDKKIDSFESNKPASYTPYKYDIKFEGEAKNSLLRVNQDGLSATVREYSLDNKNEYTVLENKNDKIKISVKRKADKLQDAKDVYVCLIKKGMSNTKGEIEWVNGLVNGKTNVFIKFIDSEGYISEDRAAKNKTKRQK